MSIRPEVQEELRSLLARGATPSRLIQHIAVCHQGEPHLHALIQNYFRETFGVPIVRNLDPLADYTSIGLDYAFLNDDVLYEMSQTRPTWDEDTTQPCWLDSLTATSLDDRIRNAKQRSLPELSRIWDTLDDRERFAVQRTLASLTGRTEQVRILARLVERLQQRINELESTHTTTMPTGELVRNDAE